MLLPAKVKIGGEELKKIEDFTMDTDIPEEIIDKLCWIGCTSFVMSGKEIAQLIESKGDKKRWSILNITLNCVRFVGADFTERNAVTNISTK